MITWEEYNSWRGANNKPARSCSEYLEYLEQMGKLTINSANLLDEDLKVELKEESWGDDPEYNLNGLRMYGQHWIGKQGHYPISFVDRQKSKK
jgi:hypothetical protein